MLPRPSRSSLAPIALASLVLVACGGGLASAKSDFKRGRLPEAKEELVALEAESASWNGTKRAEYTLYRGLVHHGLGDRAAAGVWLREAKAIEDRSPGTFSEDDRARLKLALDAVGAESSDGAPAVSPAPVKNAP